MLIVCPNCQTSYEIEAIRLGPGGRSVRCARCRTDWFAGSRVEAAPASYADAAPAMAGDVADEPPAPFRSRPAPFQIEPPDLEWHSVEPDASAADGTGVPALAGDAPPLSPEDLDDAPVRPEGDLALSEDIETVAARRARIAIGEPGNATVPARRGWLPATILVLVAVLGALIAWRAAVVRLAPQTARAYAAIGLPVNLRGLVFDALKTSEEMQDGVPVLLVQGTIVNVANRPVEVPRLRFALRNAAGLEVYAWTALPPSPTVSAGETLPFRSRLASPPGDARDMVVRFFHRNDLGPGRP